MRTSLRILLAAVVVALAAPASAGDRHHGYGKNWGNGHDRHYRHHDDRHRGHRDRRHDRRGDNVSLNLWFGLPSHYSSRSTYTTRYYTPPQTVIVQRSAPVVVYSQPRVLGYGSTTRYGGTPPGCREFNSQVVIGGRLQQAWGVACPQPDGSWRVLE
ncbi:MAG: hypothetical protein KDC48_19290 [Planctomycetes bacterium]|nr:hypothetical protein [Planctomycetota bacterium]